MLHLTSLGGRKIRLMVTAVFLAWSLVVLCTGHVHAQKSSNDLTDWWERKVPDEIKTFVSFANTIASGIADIKQGIDAATTILRVLGFLGDEAGQVNLQVEFAKLHQHIDDLGVALDWREVVTAQNDRFSQAETAVQKAYEAARDGKPLDEVYEHDSYNDLHRAEYEDVFQRYFSESATDGVTGWKQIIPDWEDQLQQMGSLTETGGKPVVYDWRLGVPALMHLIALRLPVMVAQDPHFGTPSEDEDFRQELEHHRNALIDHYQKMVDGVKCAYKMGSFWIDNEGFLNGHFIIACADLHTGFSAVSGWLPFKSRDRGYGEGYRQFLESVPPMEAPLRRQVLSKLPLFELRAMIDLLYLYTHPGLPDLTEESQGIAVAAAPHLCLDVQGGNSARGTPVWLWDCNGTDAQWWVYDRQSHTIANPAYRRCLDVKGGSSAPGAPVWLWDCNGTDAQRWAYDPEHRVLQSALGTVLESKGGVLEAGTPVWMYSRNDETYWWHEGLAQWISDSLQGVPFETPIDCLKRLATHQPTATVGYFAWGLCHKFSSGSYSEVPVAKEQLSNIFDTPFVTPGPLYRKR